MESSLNNFVLCNWSFLTDWSFLTEHANKKQTLHGFVPLQIYKPIALFKGVLMLRIAVYNNKVLISIHRMPYGGFLKKQYQFSLLYIFYIYLDISDLIYSFNAFQYDDTGTICLAHSIFSLLFQSFHNWLIASYSSSEITMPQSTLYSRTLALKKKTIKIYERAI